MPGDRIDRVISQSGDRLIFERLATPRPAPKVTLEGNWLTQQQQQQPQQPTLKEGVNSILKEIATWESNAGVRDGWKNATEVDLAAGNSMRTDSKLDVGTHVRERALSNDEANVQEIERVKNGSNKICFRGQCGAQRVEEILDSMSIMPTSRI